MTYKHGVYTSEVATSLVPPVRVDVAVPVIVGTAPVHRLPEGSTAPINVPVLIHSLPEYVAQFGAPAAGESDHDYTLTEAAKVYIGRYGFAPIICINVFDPTKHTRDGTPDVTKVAAADIIGGVDAATLKRTGLELVEEVFPRFGLVPGQLLAPGFSSLPGVALTLGAKATGINEHFDATAIIDIPNDVNRYTDVPAWLKENNLTAANSMAFFGSPLLDGVAEYGSIHLAASIAGRDSENDNIPFASPSNRRLLANGLSHGGQELFFSPREANYLNGQGVVTGLNFTGQMVVWGNRTTAYPAITDVKDSFIPIRRMFNFVGNTLVLTAWQSTDAPLRRRFIDTICDSFNIWINGLAAREFLLGGRVEFLQSDNPATDLMDGISRFHVAFTPPSPAREIDFIKEYDPRYLSALFA